MTNQQLYPTIGLPTLTSLITLTLVCLAWLSGRASDKELRREIHQEIRELRMDMDRRFERLEARFEERFDRIDERFDRIDVELRYFYGQMGDNAARLTILEKR